MTNINNGRDRFQAAYENRYTWDNNFPGYTADLVFKEGETEFTGHIAVNKDLTVEVTGIEDEKIAEGVYNQLRDVVTHRKRTSFEKAHGKNKFELGQEDSTGAIEILVEGDAMGSNYKVRGTEICQVNRVMGPMAFTINTYDSLDTGEGYISVGYNAVFRDSKTGDLKSKRDFQEEYEQVGKYYLPTRQAIEDIAVGGEKSTIEFVFSNIRLTEPAVV